MDVLVMRLNFSAIHGRKLGCRRKPLHRKVYVGRPHVVCFPNCAGQRGVFDFDTARFDGQVAVQDEARFRYAPHDHSPGGFMAGRFPNECTVFSWHRSGADGNVAT